jgi:hypothetical protein
VNRRDLIPAESGRGFLLHAGHQVGEIARSLNAGGVLIGHDDRLGEAVAETRARIDSGDRHPIFEATLAHEDVLVRIDLLLPEGDGTAWRICEVKSAASVKAYHLGDLATQVWVALGTGLPVSGADLQHIDTGFSYTRPGDYAGLLRTVDLSERVAPLVNSRHLVVTAARRCLAGGEPMIATGRQCQTPFPCPLVDHCRTGEPAISEYPPELLPGPAGRTAAAALREAGVNDLRAASLDPALPPALQRIITATRTGVAFHDPDGFRAATADWPSPLRFLDFETIAFAVPRWLGTRPFEGIPFQFSCHQEDPDGTYPQAQFLDLTGQDPSRACAEALVACLGDRGAIVAWQASVERGCLRRLARLFPDLAVRLDAAADRIVDLLPVVRNTYYHRDMRGSWSIKAVLPACLPHLNYQDLQGVKDGLAAQSAYLDAIRPDTDPVRKYEIRRQLLAYCRLDTWAMVQLYRSLKEPDNPQGQ